MGQHNYALSLSYFCSRVNLWHNILYFLAPKTAGETFSCCVWGMKVFHCATIHKLLGKFTHILALRLSFEVYLTFKFVNNMIESIFLSSVCMVIAVFSPSD